MLARIQSHRVIHVRKRRFRFYAQVRGRKHDQLHVCSHRSITKRGPSAGMDQNGAPLMKRWTNHAITLLLLSALIVAGISVYYTRQEWREMYMRVVKHR